MSVLPLTGRIGAVVEGIDIFAPPTKGEVQLIWDALDAHHVVFLRDQDVPDEAYLSFGRTLGRLTAHPTIPNLGGELTEIQVIETDGVGPERADYWHTDVTFDLRPPAASILRAVEVPACGGDTLWSSTHAAYVGLPSELRALIAGRTAAHLRKDRHGEPVHHPVVARHPRSGDPVLFVNRLFTVGMDDMPDRLSIDLLELLFNQCRFPTIRFVGNGGKEMLRSGTIERPSTTQASTTRRDVACIA